MSKTMEMITDIGLIPQISLDDPADAEPLGRALVKGGIPLAEVVLHQDTSTSLKVIQILSKQVPDIIVGAGMIHTVDQARRAVKAGAQFIITPFFNPAVTRWCLVNTANTVEIIPGITSPSDIERARNIGLTVYNFFPEISGGMAALKTLSDLFEDIKFIPMGGIDRTVMNDYLDLPNVAAVTGNFMTPSNIIKNKNWDEITALCKKVFKQLLRFELGHIGLHADTHNHAEIITKDLCTLMLQNKCIRDDRCFVGSAIEVYDRSIPGSTGYICIDTRDIERAMAYYKRRGVTFDQEQCIKDETGKINIIYLKKEVHGLAIHLHQKAK